MLPVGIASGRIGLAMVIVGVVAATLGATLETLMSSAYALAQYWGWPWGKSVPRVRAARFNALVIALLVVAAAVGPTTVDPITVTVYAVFFSAAVLPFTFVPILIAANDRRLLGDRTNGWLSNAAGSVYLVVTTAAAVAALPLLIATKAGL